MRRDHDAALYGIAARLRGYVQSAPRLRYAADGAELLEFKVKLVEDWPPPPAAPAEEIVVARFAGRQRELEQWLAYGRHVLLGGTLHLARWTGAQDGRERAQLLLEATDIQPLDQERPDPERAAAYAPPPSWPANREPPTDAERLARAEALVSAVEDPPEKASPETAAERTKRLSQRYTET
jgi:hypothetical protein